MDPQKKELRFARLSEAFNEFNQWAPCRKGVVISFGILAVHILYWLCFEAIVWLFNGDVLVDVALTRQFLWLWIGSNFCMMLVALYYARINSNSVTPFNIGAYVYTGFTMLFCHGLGFMDSVYSAFILLLVLGILILEPQDLRAVFVMLASWAVVALASGIAVDQDWLRYAPLIADHSPTARSNLGWYLLSYIWIFQAVLLISVWVAIVGISRQHALNTVEQATRLIRRYVPPAVAERIIAGDAEGIETPQRRRITMLHSDVAGFTELADKIEPEALTQVLSEYLDAMAQIVERHQGTLCEYSGDGILAIFGAPKEMPPEQQVEQAVAAACSMQRTLRLLNRNWQELGVLQEVQIRIGINTGQVSVGSFGSQGRMTYTAIGLQANITARIQFEALPGGIVLSDRSQQLLSDKDSTELVGLVAVKGVHNPIKIHRIQSLDD
jgi:class 3 adenylate cyclase